MRQSTRVSFPVLALLAVACVEPTPPASGPERAPIAIAIENQPDTLGSELVDVCADGAAIWGRAWPAPANATVLPLYDAWLVTPDGGVVDLPVDGGAVRDARFGPVGAPSIALLDRHHTLWLWNPKSGERIEVSADAFLGMSFSSDGRALVYAAGPRPELELYVFDVERRASRQVTRIGAPLALPAFDESGGSIVFASAFRGVPALWIVDADGTGLRQLTNREITSVDFQVGHRGVPMPEGRRPPLWRGTEIVFEAEGDVFAVGTTGDVRWVLTGADLPHLSQRGRLWVRTADGTRAVGKASR